MYIHIDSRVCLIYAKNYYNYFIYKFKIKYILNHVKLIFLLLGFNHVGGYNAMKEKYMEALPSTRDLNSTCGLPRKDAFHIFLDAAGQENPWPGLVFQASVGCLWYWCCDQVCIS